MSFVFLFSLLALFSVCYSKNTCSWSVSGGKLDMCGLMKQDIKCSWTQSGIAYQLSLSPFANTMSCDGTTSMCTQTGGQKCFYVGLEDNGVTPVSSSVASEAWQFEYKNGEASGSCVSTVIHQRYADIIFICKEGSTYIPYNAATVTCSEESACTYQMTIETQYACAGKSPGGGGGGGSSGISGGSVFLIIIFVGFALYWIVGFIYFGIQNDKNWTDFQGSCPHYAFWIALPALVVAGCCITKEYIMNAINKDGGESSNALVDDDEDDD